jgi:hypothetical protein
MRDGSSLSPSGMGAAVARARAGRSRGRRGRGAAPSPLEISSWRGLAVLARLADQGAQLLAVGVRVLASQACSASSRRSGRRASFSASCSASVCWRRAGVLFVQRRAHRLQRLVVELAHQLADVLHLAARPSKLVMRLASSSASTQLLGQVPAASRTGRRAGVSSSSPSFCSSVLSRFSSVRLGSPGLDLGASARGRVRCLRRRTGRGRNSLFWVCGTWWKGGAAAARPCGASVAQVS